ncbi:MAG: inositol monophosphatase [Syntrophobacterales bacterium]|nr:inositol monophosphatase [Syntrophobacterales bacterium]
MTEELNVEGLKKFIVEILQEAGRIAMEGYGQGRPDKKFDEDMVTSFEVRIETFVRSQINKAFPGHMFFGDDSTIGSGSDYRHDVGKYLWVFDALDGVANYQAGIPMWGMSCAVMENFWPLVGAYLMPSTGDMWVALGGGSMFFNGRERKIVETEPTNNESLLFTYSRFHDHFRTTFPGKIRNLGCTGAHICYVAQGRADGAIVHNVAFKDMVSPLLILESAGGSVEYFDGGRFYINEYADGRRIKDFLLIAPKGFHEQLRSYLERTDMIE